MKNDTQQQFSEKWNTRFMELAQTISTWSKDESTKVGCVVVGPDKEIRSMGYNGFPRGVNDDIAERHNRPQKYQYTEHAERNAIYNTTYYGGSVRGCTMFITMPPCVDCARAIIQSGISKVVFLAPNEDPKSHIAGWRDTVKTSFEMFDEVGVKYHVLNKSKKQENVAFSQIIKMINPADMNDLSKKLIAKNTADFQISLCMEELNELATEIFLGTSFQNTAEETADVFITLNHITCAYNIREQVDNAIDKKMLNQKFMTDPKQRFVALLALQKDLLKNINRRENNVPNIINRVADAYIALGKLIISENSFTAVRDAARKKIERTIQKNSLTK